MNKGCFLRLFLGLLFGITTIYMIIDTPRRRACHNLKNVEIMQDTTWNNLIPLSRIEMQEVPKKYDEDDFKCMMLTDINLSRINHISNLDLFEMVITTYLNNFDTITQEYKSNMLKVLVYDQDKEFRDLNPKDKLTIFAILCSIIYSELKEDVELGFPGLRSIRYLLDRVLQVGETKTPLEVSKNTIKQYLREVISKRPYLKEVKWYNDELSLRACVLYIISEIAKSDFEQLRINPAMVVYSWTFGTGNGKKHPKITSLQLLLKTYGYDDVEVNGILSTNTINAVYNHITRKNRRDKTQALKEIQNFILSYVEQKPYETRVLLREEEIELEKLLFQSKCIIPWKNQDVVKYFAEKGKRFLREFRHIEAYTKQCVELKKAIDYISEAGSLRKKIKYWNDKKWKDVGELIKMALDSLNQIIYTTHENNILYRIANEILDGLYLDAFLVHKASQGEMYPLGYVDGKDLYVSVVARNKRYGFVIIRIGTSEELLDPYFLEKGICVSTTGVDLCKKSLIELYKKEKSLN